MSAWNELNTAGFSQDELAMLSNAQERLAREFPGIDESNLNDLLNNSWYAGITEDEIVDVARHPILGRPDSHGLDDMRFSVP